MLKKLTVRNLAVVEKAEAEFSPGLNVVTGETGAGKSVLMGALALVAGARADSAVVRDGAKEARVEAEFSLSGDAAREAARILNEAGIFADEDGDGADASAASDAGSKRGGGEAPRSLVVRRTVGANGAGRVWIDDSPSTVATLRKLGRVLVDVHGPSANLRLLDESFQRGALDASGGVDASAYAERWRGLAEARAAVAEMEGAMGDADEIDVLKYQVGELEGAELSDDDEDLPARHAAQAHAEEIAEGAAELTEALGGDGGVAESLSRLAPRLAAMSRHLPAASEWALEVEELTVRAQELSRTIADAASKMDADPETLERLDERLGLLNRLKRKYLKGDRPGAVRELMEILERKRARLEAIEGGEEKLSALRDAEKAAFDAAVREGAALAARRKAAAVRLAAAVTRELRDLGFLQSKFSVAVERAEPCPSGCDRVEYFFEPNPGEGARPLAEIASSGETARVMLAVKGVLAGRGGADVMVFDEIDANVGGETGRVVGEKLRAVAEGRQVVAITHLPQSAVYAARHLVVSKAVAGGRTRTAVAAVEGEARIAEVERMLGGGDAASAARRHAEELLAQAAAAVSSKPPYRDAATRPAKTDRGALVGRFAPKPPSETDHGAAGATRPARISTKNQRRSHGKNGEGQ